MRYKAIINSESILATPVFNDVGVCSVLAALHETSIKSNY